KPTDLSQLNADLSALCRSHFECRGDTCPARWEQIDREIAEAWNKREAILRSLPSDRARAVGAGFPSRECQDLARRLAPSTPQYHARANCVRFPQNANPEAQVRYLLSHPNTRVCPSGNPDPVGQAETLRRGMNQGYDNTMGQIGAKRGA